MRELFWFLKGYMQLKIEGANPAWALNRLTNAQIVFWNVNRLDDFSFSVFILRKDWDQAEQLISHAMCETECLNCGGVVDQLQKLVCHKLLLGLLILGVSLTVILPQFVFFYHVEGNQQLEEAQILRALEEVNVSFGTYGPSIKPQWVKDRILSRMPELQWITITQNGCMANVVVRERLEKEKIIDRKQFSNIVASQNGIITEQSILAGTAVHQVGDVVQKGELLVSGVVDLERAYAVDNAQAEIYARTWRESTVVSPDTCGTKEYLSEETKNMWLVVGKKRIKLFGNSSFSGTECDKITVTRQFVLPGGFCLPVSLIEETYLPYTVIPSPLREEMVQPMLETYVLSKTEKAMIAGEIQSHSHTLSQNRDLFCLRSTLECHEMIALTVPAKWNEEGHAND